MGDDGDWFLEVPGSVEGYDMDSLKVDESYLTVTSEFDTPLYLYAISHDCHKCPYQQLDSTVAVAAENNTLFTISSRYAWDFLISNINTSYIPLIRDDQQPLNASFQCQLPDVSLGEFGVYDLTVTEDLCQLDTVSEPVFIYGGLIICLLVYGVLATGVQVVPVLLRSISNTGLASCCRGVTSESQMDFNLGAPESAATKKAVGKQRIKSLDTFRGLSIALMILVNYNAGNYWFMGHATWDGLHVADLVFPWFLWIMGVCIPMGQRSALKRNVPKTKIFLRIFKRSLKLFMLGIVLNSLGGWITLSEYRVPGVLQRFAVCYLVVATVSLYTPQLQLTESKVTAMLSDVIVLAYQWLFYLLVVVVHTVLMFSLPVPGCPTGYIGPGGVVLLNDEGEPSPDCIGGATGYVDRWILGVEHIYQNPTAKQTYSSGPFDPEGVLGSMLSVFQVFLGLVAGTVLQHHSSDNERLLRWLGWGVLCGVLGAILCFAGVDGAPIPVNKNLWSLSYVLVTSCFAFLLLALFYLLIDKLHLWSGSPLYQAGMNSILLYVGHNVTYNLFPWHYVIGAMRTHAAILGECLWGTTLWIITGLYLHHRGKFYTI
uniref:Heparan-alpha-glucosaminide N-acetyltransferase-like n=1 Tax=Hirondellea gigas TaxID=1518452 RepID=A0A6A7G702_9CRUS